MLVFNKISYIFFAIFNDHLSIVILIIFYKSR